MLCLQGCAAAAAAAAHLLQALEPRGQARAAPDGCQHALRRRGGEEHVRACVQGLVAEVLDQAAHALIGGRDEIHASHLRQGLAPHRHILHHCSSLKRSDAIESA